MNRLESDDTGVRVLVHPLSVLLARHVTASLFIAVLDSFAAADPILFLGCADGSRSVGRPRRTKIRGRIASIPISHVEKTD